jgi:hypothetical protein
LFIAAKVVSLNPGRGLVYSIQHYLMNCFSWVLRVPPLIKLIAALLYKDS